MDSLGPERPHSKCFTDISSRGALLGFVRKIRAFLDSRQANQSRLFPPHIEKFGGKSGGKNGEPSAISAIGKRKLSAGTIAVANDPKPVLSGPPWTKGQYRGGTLQCDNRASAKLEDSHEKTDSARSIRHGFVDHPSRAGRSPIPDHRTRGARYRR